MFLDQNCLLMIPALPPTSTFFFFNDTATTEIYTLSLHDALPISQPAALSRPPDDAPSRSSRTRAGPRSEEHTSELQSQSNLVCRLLLEKKKLMETLWAGGNAAYVVGGSLRDALLGREPSDWHLTT